MKNVVCVNLGDACAGIEDHLREQGWNAWHATDLPEAQRLLAQASAQVGVLLLGHLAASRLTAVQQLLRSSPEVEWVGVFTPQALDSAVLRQLALDCLFDYHTLPVDWRVLDLTLGHAFRRSRLRERQEVSPEVINSMGMVGSSAAIAQLRQQIRKVTQSEAPVLIGGESGTGKELAARAIHQGSARASGPFVAVNCGAISPSLIHTELFGHERGSFTGATAGKQGLIESANGGTLFLDEITDLPLELQTNLLRFLQERTIHRVGSTRSLEVNARVIAASHVELSQAVAAGRFREDLFYRLNVLPITVPSLRERLADVPMLAQHFLQCCRADRHRRPVQGFSRQAIASLMSHDWPGNVRELFNRVQRAVVMTDQRFITPCDLGFSVKDPSTGPALDEVRTLAERNAISLTLGRVDRNITHAARELGISRMTLYRLMDKHGLAHQMQ
ncbi:sigma-54 dependent transcriptional regulator [Polaromonas glacialis]|uniref:sigma-54 dependent transcriptional regulator n=1 Tax=Polaromonas glacialis TaxID=866564 RepID=UPI000A790192|nr:sigma-54 dependent transcriptional regulator [Polaromonas glacialis]